jgi:hypothetical protein
MERKHLLAAELYSYSLENYRNHLGIGNIRFESLMPQDALLLERAESERWSDERIAKELEVEKDAVPKWRKKIMRAKNIIDADDPAESFRLGVRFSIQDALESGISSSEDIDGLVTQICYRASDLSVLLKLRGESLSKYSDALRQET